MSRREELASSNSENIGRRKKGADISGILHVSSPMLRLAPPAVVTGNLTECGRVRFRGSEPVSHAQQRPPEMRRAHSAGSRTLFLDIRRSSHILTCRVAY